MLDASKVVQADMQDSGVYIDVMHGQIGDSMAESEREVVQVIEQIGLLNSQAAEKREHIRRSIASGKALENSTNERVEANRVIITELGRNWRPEHGDAFDFGRIENLAGEVRALTPLIKVITSIASRLACWR